MRDGRLIYCYNFSPHTQKVRGNIMHTCGYRHVTYNPRSHLNHLRWVSRRYLQFSTPLTDYRSQLHHLRLSNSNIKYDERYHQHALPPPIPLHHNSTPYTIQYHYPASLHYTFTINFTTLTFTTYNYRAPLTHTFTSFYVPNPYTHHDQHHCRQEIDRVYYPRNV